MQSTIHDSDVLDMRRRVLERLREARGDLVCARLSVLQASVDLVGPRARRAGELREKITDAFAHVERLIFFVEGDDQ